MKKLNTKIKEMDEEKSDKMLKIMKSKKIMAISIIVMVLLFVTTFQFGIFLAIVYFGIIKALEFNKKHRAFMKTFAKKNNLIYSAQLDVKTMEGRLFNIGHSKRIYHAVYGDYEKYPMKIFNYYYTVGSGKNSRTYSFTVCEINFKGLDFPHIFLRSHSMSRYGTQVFWGQDKDVKISLEKEFDSKFELYCTQDYEIETLQIFTSKLLNYLVEHGNHFSIEFSEDKVYIYDDKIIRNEEELNELYELVKKILDDSGESIKRLGDDFEAMHQSYRK